MKNLILLFAMVLSSTISFASSFNNFSMTWGDVRTENDRQECQKSHDKLNDIVMKAERYLLGTEEVALRSRLIEEGDKFTVCVSEVYSFNQDIVFTHKETVLKTHLGSMRHRKSACLSDLEEVKRLPNLINITRYYADFDLLYGHVCNIKYTVLEKK